MSNESRLTDPEIAWCAGIFEGEGNIGSVRKAGPRHKERMTPRLQFASTDLDVVEHFHRLMRGKIRGPYQGRPNEKPYWRWDVNSWDELERVGSLMRPWFGLRRGARFDYVMSLMPQRFRRPFAYKPCDYPPTASIAGYLKHRRRGERACEVCMESYRLYQRDYLPKWRAKRQAISLSGNQPATSPDAAPLSPVGS